MNAPIPPQYRQPYQQRVQQSPHARRAPAPPAAMQHQRDEHERQQREQARVAAMNLDAAKRRAMKPTDKTMPDGVDQLVIGDGVDQYKQLREMERRLDAVMMRKRLDLQDSLYNIIRKYSKMRVWISNTVANQPWQGSSLDDNAFDFNTGIEATYKVKIEGRLLEDEEENDSDDDSDAEDQDKKNEDAMDHDAQKFSKNDELKADDQTPPSKRAKFSHFFKAITIDFDRNKNLQPDGTTQIEWKKPAVNPASPVLPQAADFDSLEFERKSDENINCTINLYRDETPERFQLSKELADLLDTEEDDRGSILMGIWDYIKAMGLQQDEEKRLIQCDERLRAVFNQDTIFFPHIPARIPQLIHPVPPLTLSYTIRVDPDHHSSPGGPKPTIYDILIPTHPAPPSLPALQNIDTLRTLSAQDDHLALLIAAIGQTQRKHDFLSGMARDPVNFTKRWMASQRRDLEVILGEDGRYEDGAVLGGEWARGGKRGVWGSEKVQEAVGLMVQKASPNARGF